MHIQYLIITALELEYKAVAAFLRDIAFVTHPTTGSIYNVGIFKIEDKNVKVALVEAGPGNAKTADETGRAIDFFTPRFVFFVGVGGGVKDVKLGDVVISSKIIGYETGKADEKFKPRFDVPDVSYRLEQVAKEASRKGEWRNRIKNLKVSPDTYVKPIAAGEKVVSSIRAEVYQYLKQYASDAIAVEMEGVGFLTSIRAYAVHGIVIRGISDLIEKKEEADKAGYQPIAANHAAAFAFEMINMLADSLNRSADRLNDLAFKNRFIDLLVELYEQGPEQDDIWKRAGGSTSIFVNIASRKSQWYRAVDHLSKGGGGNISFESLVLEIKKDYPNRDVEADLLMGSR